MTRASIFLVIAGLASALYAEANPNKWEEVENDDGIRVWARDVPGSEIREVKAETIVSAPAKRVWEVLGDISHYVEFMPYMVEAKTIAEHEKGHYEYQLIDPPLVDKRDYTVKVTLEADDTAGVYKRSWVPANGKGPKPKDGVVRVEINQGTWTIKAIGADKAKVTYYLYTNPGGSIPDWIANKANTTSLPDLMTAVRNRSVDPKWRR